MKKLLCIILAALMFMLPACGTAPTPTTPTATTTPVETTPTPTTPTPTTPAATDAYQSPDVIPITDTEKAEIEREAISYESMFGGRFYWFDDERVETRHNGWRYYGRMNGGILVGKPHSDPRKYNDLVFFPQVTLILYKESQFTSILSYGLDSSTFASLSAYSMAYESAILQREDLDNPCWYGGQNLPALVDSIYYDADAVASLRKGYGYLGTYNGYSVCYSEDGLRGSGVKIIGGVAFWVGQHHFFSVHDQYLTIFIAGVRLKSSCRKVTC